MSVPRVGPGYPLSCLFPPLPFTSLSCAFFLLFFFPFLVRFTYFLFSSIPSLSTRIVPLHFQAGDRRRRSNLSLVWSCSLCVNCIAITRCCLRDPTFSRFDTIPACDRHTQTDRHTMTANTRASMASHG